MSRRMIFILTDVRRLRQGRKLPMPEMPEVETVRLSLRGSLVGREIVEVRVGAFSGVVGDEDVDFVAMRLRGRQILDLRRRAKYLIADLDDGTVLLVHLRMTGSLTLVPATSEPLRFQHLAITLDDGNDLRFADQRKFGRVLHLPAEAITSLDARLGPEPLSVSFTTQSLSQSLQRRSGPIKSILLNQEVIAGLGNIYVDEALFRSRIHPLKRANSLSEAELRRLHGAVRAVLREGLENRGTSFSSFRDGYGASGSNQGNLRVYGRGDKGLPCLRCGGPLVRLTIGGRGSHFCPHCQPESSNQNDDDRVIDTST
jgi:formamidopyrimidine-DNA glycosylase